MEGGIKQSIYPSNFAEPYIMKRSIEIMQKGVYKCYSDNAAFKNMTPLEWIQHYTKLEADDTSDNKFYACALYNYALFFPILQESCNSIQYPRDGTKFADCIVYTWPSDSYLDSFALMFDEMNKKAIKMLESGWLFLNYNIKRKKLYICTLPSHDNPLCYENSTRIPIFAWNLWEHAYYLQYENRKCAYVKNLWYLMNWNAIEQRFEYIADKSDAIQMKILYEPWEKRQHV